MADRDGGVAGSEWNRDRARAEYCGGPLNPVPLATALPAPYPPFSVSGGPSPLPSDMQGGDSSESIKPHPVVWHSVPPIAGSSPSSSSPVSNPPSVYLGTTARPPFTPGFAQPPPMVFPSLIKLEVSPPVRSSPTSGLEALRSSALPAVTSAPAYASHGTPLPQVPYPRSSLPSGMNEAEVSAIATFTSASSGDLTSAAVLQRLDASIPMRPPSTNQQDIIALDHTDPKRGGPNCDQVENASVLIASSISPTNLLSSDPSVGFAEPPHVPETFPRDPVPQGGRGEGWPYAPQGWPKPGDKWGWRVGKRASANSLWIDRYITVPVSLMKGKRAASKIEFASRKSLVEYLKQNFPQLKDPYSIFKAFDWKVPAPKNLEAPEKPEKRGSTIKRDKISPRDGDDNWQKSKKQCRAGNPDCLLTKAKDNEAESLGSLVCDICCSEPSFCRECKCILCCKFFLPDADDFSIIRCLNFPLAGQGICGHAAHLECALDSHLVGIMKKNGLGMYICRRCDMTTDLKETVNRLVDVMGKTATQSKIESSLQLALRIVQDPEDEARSSGKILATVIGDALKKVQDGADIVESYKELAEHIHGLQAGRSRATGRKRALEDSLHLSETSLEKRVLHSKSGGSPDARVTPSSMFQENSQGTPAVSTRQGSANGISPAVHRIDSLIVSLEGFEADEVATTSGTRLQHVLDLDKELPSTLLNPLKPEDQVLSITTSQIPSEHLSCAPLLSSLLDQSVSKPPTLSIEEHIRQCEAMTNRVKGAGQFNTQLTIFSVTSPGTLEVDQNSDSKPPSLTAGSLTVEVHESEGVNSLAEGSHGTDPPCAGELVTSIPSSSRAKSPSLFNSQDAVEDDIATTEIRKVSKSSRRRPATRSSSRAKSPSLSNAGGDDNANRQITEVFKSPRTGPPMLTSSGGKGPSLSNSQDAGGGDVAITQIIEVPVEKPPTTPSFDPALEPTHAAGLEAEFEDQICDALEKLKRAQATEYARAEELLNAQKKIVIEQYRQLENVCGQFAKKDNVELFPHQFKKDPRDKPRAEFDRAMNHLMAQYGKAQEGQKVFESMLAISNGFGHVSKEFLQEFFKWPPSDIAEA